MNKKSFSKRLLIADYVILVGLIVAFLICTAVGVDTSNLAIVLGAWVAQIAISSGAYYWKAKSENLVKMPLYLLQELPDDMREKADPNDIISAVLGIGTD